MIYPKLIFLILCSLTFFIVGCSNQNEQEKVSFKEKESTPVVAEDSEEKQSSEEDSSNEELQVDPLPSTYDELAELPQGKDSGYFATLTPEDKQNALERFKDLPNIKGNPTEQELDYFYQELLKRVQQDFTGPEELIKQLKFQSFGDPEIEDTRYQFKENLNVEVILDASGSMAQDVGGKSKMETAKAEILQFVEGLPEGARMGLRVYGHKGSNEDSDKALSCSSSDILYPLEAYDSQGFQAALDEVEPTGWTPISLALSQAQEDLSQYDGETNTNIVYLVSDGIETCDEDPVTAAKNLYDSNMQPIINVIGFDVDNEGQQQLKDIASATEGIYQNVQDQQGLKEEFEKINNVAQAWEDWKEKGEQAIESEETRNFLDIFGYITQEIVKEQDERTRISLLMTVLKDNEYMSKESYSYLEEKNSDYHDWIREEIEKFNVELKSLNQQNYEEAKKALEEKYKVNTQ